MRAYIVLSIGLLLAACGSKESEVPAAPEVDQQAQEDTVLRYKWYLEGSTPAGESTIRRSGDGFVNNESFVHWNNREYTLHSEFQLDEGGMIVALKLSGISPFGATIDESFVYKEGKASWATPGENGSAESADPAFYFANEWAAVGSRAALVRQAVEQMDGELALFPSGTATVAKVLDQSVETPAGNRELALYAVSGTSFTPAFYWFDEDMELAAIGGSYIGMIRDGWGNAALEELTRIEQEQDAILSAKTAQGLAYSATGPVVFDKVNVVDVVNGEVLDGRYVEVRDGKIAEISTAAIDSPGALHIDAEGRFLSPGLWDMHGHLSLSDGILNIASGVTNVRDIGNVHETIMEISGKFDSGEVIGPRVYRAGFIDKAGPYSAGSVAETLEDALQRVDFYADHGYIQIKLYSSIEPAWVAPIAERAHERGMRLSGHIPAFMSAEQAVRAGYDEIQHINMVFLNFLAGDREDTRKQLRFTLYGDEAGNLDLDSDEVQAFFALLKSNEVTVDPTAAIFETQLIHHSGEPDPTFAAVIDHLPPAVARPLYNPEMDMGDKVEAWANSAVKQAAMLKALHDHGIQIVPGTDNIAGFTLHRELEVYAEAGIPVADVVRIATLDSARIAGADDRTGSIEAGKDADLVLLAGNPLESVSAYRQGTLVMKGDTLYRPEDLYSAAGVKPFLPSEPLPE